MRKVSTGVMIVLALLLSLPASAVMTHRYPFTVDANDVVGTAGGTLMGNAAISNGQVVLDGVIGTYVDLPGPTINIPSYSAVTIEQWITSSPSNTAFTMTFVTGNTGDPGTQYLDMQPTRSSPPAGDGCRFTITDTQWSTEAWSQAPQMADGIQHHLVGVCDNVNIQLFVDGVAMPSMALTTQSLGLVSNATSYLGRSCYTATGDAYFIGSINETRIYNHALSAPAVVLNYQLGPNNIKTCGVTAMSPANNATLVPIPTPLSWTPDPGINVLSYEVFVKTDPNLLDPNSVPVPVGTPDYSGANTTYTKTGLANSTVYYYRVDTIATDLQRYPGPRYKFTTVPPNATITTQPQDLTVALGATANFTVAGTNIVSYAWYKVGTPDLPLTDTGKYSGTITGTLTITDVQIPEEGKYYCIVTGSPGTSPLTVKSNSVRLWTQRLVGLWKLENNMLDSVTTEVPGAPTHDGTFVPGTGGVETYAAGISGNGMIFNNTAGGTRVDIAAAVDNDFFNFYSKGITVNLWYKGTLNAWRLPVCKLQVAGTGITPTGWLIGMNTGTNTTAQWIFENAAPSLATSNAVNLRDGNWHMITGIYDPVAKQMRTYVDGTNPTQLAKDLTNYHYSSNALPVNIGGRVTESSIGATVDEVRIYTYPLTANEVAELYYQLRGAFCQTKPVYDFSGDCKENLADLAIFAARWLECGIYPAAGNCY